MRLAECVDQTAEKVAGVAPGDPLTQFSESKLAGAINGNEHVEFAFFGPNLGDIDVKVSNRICFERLLRFGSLDGWQPTDAVALKQAVQSRQQRQRQTSMKLWKDQTWPRS